jgi:apolipoprotein N-acyltransferase
MRLIAFRVFPVSFVLGTVGMAANAEPLMWLAAALGLIALAALVADLGTQRGGS